MLGRLGTAGAAAASSSGGTCRQPSGRHSSGTGAARCSRLPSRSKGRLKSTSRGEAAPERTHDPCCVCAWKDQPRDKSAALTAYLSLAHARHPAQLLRALCCIDWTWHTSSVTGLGEGCPHLAGWREASTRAAAAPRPGSSAAPAPAAPPASPRPEPAARQRPAPARHRAHVSPCMLACSGTPHHAAAMLWQCSAPNRDQESALTLLRSPMNNTSRDIRS